MRLAGTREPVNLSAERFQTQDKDTLPLKSSSNRSTTYTPALPYPTMPIRHAEGVGVEGGEVSAAPPAAPLLEDEPSMRIKTTAARVGLLVRVLDSADGYTLRDN